MDMVYCRQDTLAGATCQYARKYGCLPVYEMITNGKIEYFLNETREAESKRNAALFISGTGSLSHDALSSKLGGFVPGNYDVIPGPNLDVYATGTTFSPRAMRLIEEGSWESIPSVFNVPQWFYEQIGILDSSRGIRSAK